MNLQQFAMNLISRNPNVRNNPTAQAMVQAIESGDNARGEQLASNLIQSMGVSREDAIAQARRFFSL